MKNAKWVIPLIVVALVAASFAMGMWFAKPEWQNAQEAASPIPVSATVESRIVDDRPEIAGAIIAPSTHSIRINASSLPDPAVITIAPPTTISYGARLVEISGKPYFVLPGPLPMYRDLRADDSGEDVRALQVSLNTIGHGIPETGIVGSLTLNAVEELFTNAGYQLPRETVHATVTGPSASPSPTGNTKQITRRVIPSTQLVSAATGRTSSRANVEDRVDAGTVVASIASSERTLTAIIPEDVLSRFPIKQAVNVNIDGKQYAGTVASIGAFVNGQDGKLPGYPAQIKLTTAHSAPVKVGQSALVTLPGTEIAEGAAVPIVAVRHDAQGDFVLVNTTQGEPPARTAVKILRTADGWAAVSGVTVGTEIRVTD